ncbi:MAG TPA: heavy-metal-associated domain-containing protein [Allocoleopsis sp.]
MTIQLKVPNMACSACSDTITKAVKSIDPGATVQADPKTKQVKIETQAPEDTVTQAIISAGYQVKQAAATITTTHAAERAQADLSQDFAQSE